MITMSIEELLVWAYRDQRADKLAGGANGLGPSASSFSDTLSKFMALGTTVDTGMVTTEVSEYWDLRTIDASVMALDNFWIEWRDGEVLLWDLASIKQAGLTVVNGQGGVCLLPVLNPDLATPIHVTTVATSVTIILHAREATQPEYHSGWTMGRGRRAATATKGFYGRSDAGRELEIRDVERDRMEYHLWRAALDLLRENLIGKLHTVALDERLPPASPWLIPRKVIKSDLRAMNSNACKPLKKKRKKLNLT